MTSMSHYAPNFLKTKREADEMFLFSVLVIVLALGPFEISLLLMVMGNEMQVNAHTISPVVAMQPESTVTTRLQKEITPPVVAPVSAESVMIDQLFEAETGFKI
jgi:hypothetical protein